MNRHYLITLTPMDWFFFGGERTLDDGKSADYISHGATTSGHPSQTPDDGG